MLEAILFIIWWITGVWSFIYWWTKDYDLTTTDLILAIFGGLITGPVNYLIGWATSDDLFTREIIKPKVLIKRKYRDDPTRKQTS